MSLSKQVITADDLRRFRHYHFVRHCGKNVFFLVYKHLFLEGQPKTIREILDFYGILYSDFYYNEIIKLSGRPEDLDITMMNKICHSLWDIGVNYRGRRLQYLIRNIVDERNDVCHGERNITQKELENKINSFQITLEDTLDEAKRLMLCDGVKTDQLKVEIRDVVPNLLEKIREEYDPSKPDELKKLQDEIKDFGDYILQLTQEELKSLFIGLCQIYPYDWLVRYGVTNPCDTTVSLKMDQEKEFHGCYKSQGSITLDQSKILKIKAPNGNDPKTVIISGCAGSGKTTILCYYLEKWLHGAKDVPNLSSFEIVLYMQFRDHRHDNFDDYLQSLLPQTLGLFNLERIKSVIMRSKCLILCDGYDEANNNSRKLFEELVALNCKDMKIVVTTRPGNTEKLTKFINKAKHNRINLSILGLRKEVMKPLIEKITSYLITDDITKKDEMRRGLLQVTHKMDETMMAILKTPLYFNLFILLYIDSSDIRERLKNENISATSTLYILLDEHKQKRIMEKTGIEEEYLKEFDEIYLRYSLQNYKEKKYELSKTDVNKMKSETQCQEVINNFDSLLSSYFNIKHSIEGLEMKKVYCYRHASELEFAAARKICEDIRKSFRPANELDIRKSSRPASMSVMESLCTFILGGGICGVGSTPSYHLDIWKSIRPTDELVIRKSHGKQEENIVEIVLISSGIREMWNTNFPVKLRKLEGEVTLWLFIIGILYNLKGNVFQSIINEIHDSLLKSTERFFACRFDFLLKPYIETSLDPKVLDSLVLTLGSDTKIFMGISQTESLCALPNLLPKLKLKNLDINLDFHKGRDFPSLTNTLEIATLHKIPVFLDLKMDLRAMAQMSGADSYSARILGLTVNDFENYDLSDLCPIPISSPRLSVVYNGNRNNIEEVSHIINVIWPTRKGGSDASLTIRNLFLTEWDIRYLIKSLDVQLLEELCLPWCSVSSQEIMAELSSECRKKGLGELRVGEELQGVSQGGTPK